MSSEMRPKVLITGASGDSAQGVIKALRAASKAYVIASVCIHERNPGFLMSDISAVAPPCIHEEEYIDFLVNFIKQNSINVLIPTIDGELPLISKRRMEIEERSKAKVVVGGYDAITTCCDKLATSQYLASVGVSQPELITGGFEKIRRYVEGGATVIMKPRMGGGSRGIRILDHGTLESVEWKTDEYIYQKFEHYQKEFTSVVMKDKNQVVAMAVLERVLSGGRTVWSRRVRSTPYESMLEAVVSGLDMPYLNIQFGAVGEKFQVFDLNPRFSGSTSVFSLVFNGPDLLVQKALLGNMPLFSCTDRYFESMRYYEDYVVNRTPDE